MGRKRQRFDRAKTHINLDLARELIISAERSGNIRTMMAAAVQGYGEDIVSELEIIDGFRSGDAAHHAQRCLIFAIVSPLCDFDVNCAAAVRFHAKLHDVETQEDVYNALTDNNGCKWMGCGNSAKSLHRSLEFIRNVTDADMDKRKIRALNDKGVVGGLGEKTAAMACALYDSAQAVYTLDTHMWRWLMVACGRPELVAGTMTANDNAYQLLEGWLMSLHGEIAPEYPPFVSQWAVWNVQRGNVHVSHLPIFD